MYVCVTSKEERLPIENEDSEEIKVGRRERKKAQIELKHKMNKYRIQKRGFC